MIPIPPKLALWGAKYGAKVGKWVLIAVLAVAYHAAIFYAGVHKERNVWEYKEATEAAAQAAQDLMDADARVPVIEQATEDRADLNGKLDKGMEKLNEATKNSGDKPDCELTDDELRALREINEA
jgi:hypothetical protein